MVGTLLGHLPEKFRKASLPSTVALKVMFLISHVVLLLFSGTPTNLSNIMASLYKGFFLGQERTNLDELLSIPQSPVTLT